MKYDQIEYHFFKFIYFLALLGVWTFVTKFLKTHFAILFSFWQAYLFYAIVSSAFLIAAVILYDVLYRKYFLK